MTVNNFTPPIVTGFSSTGVTVPGATLTFYTNNATTKQDIYTDAALTIKHPNPITAGDDGRFDLIFMQEKLYGVKHDDDEGNLIWYFNNLNSSGVSSANIRRVFTFIGDGVTTAFDTLQSGLPTTQINYDIFIQGIAQKKNVDTYSISGTTVNFVTPPPDTMLVEISVTQPVAGLLALEFTSLIDVPITYVGSGGYNVRVNVAETALEFNSFLNTGAATELTIASGTITATTSFHSVDTEADAATDDVDNISGGVGGDRLVLVAANDARDIVLKDATGNLRLAGGDFTMDSTADTIELIRSGSIWQELTRSNNT